jgi:hypothetical protein
VSDGGDGGQAPVTPVCGNGKIEEGEGCDDGENNGLYLLACAPDCSRVIEEKHIMIGDQIADYMAPDVLATADSACPSGYKALFSYGSQRRATTVPFKTVNSVDWVLRPYTYYYNPYENPVWLTRDVALLGIENGEFVGLENNIGNVTYVAVSNMRIDGTGLTSSDENCGGWAKTNTGLHKRYGVPLTTDETYLFNPYTLECGYAVAPYCVEQ